MTDMEFSLQKELGDVFRSEVADLFSDMETAVLDLETEASDPDAVHRLFRAVHTLKGSAAMFGLTRLAGLAHELESLIERVRELKVHPDAELISLVLRLTDALRLLAEDPETGAVNERDLAQALVKATASLSEKPEQSPTEKRKIAIFFKPFPAIFTAGMDPGMVLEELRDLGVLSVRVVTDEVPDLENLAPETCFLAFDMVLETQALEKEIEDVFLFVAEDSVLRMEVLPSAMVFEPPVPSSPLTPAENADGKTASHSFSREKPPVEPHPPEGEDIRIAAFRLDTLMSLVGELVMQQARLNDLNRTLRIPVLEECLEGLDRIAMNLKDCVLNLRMTPIAGTFARFRRMVRDLCRDLGKEVILEMEGGETELDKGLIDGIGEPLVHLVRNALSHGIELPEERRRKGKTAAGRLKLSAAAVEGRVEITVEDDGRGIDRTAVLSRARERGLVREDENPEAGDVDALIFYPGLSTAAAVGAVSGRGVGMDVVRRQVEALAGRIRLTSESGKGTRVLLSLPLTLAIVECLMVRVGESVFAIPISQVEACMDFVPLKREVGARERLIRFRKTALPYIVLADFFAMESLCAEGAQVVFVRTEAGFVGLVVDVLCGVQQVVIKSMGAWYDDRQDGIAGATVMGDGSIAFVLDIQGVWRRACAEKREKDGGGGVETRKGGPGARANTVAEAVRSEEGGGRGVGP
jgi:two-component system chemotaxis sensor kinase CheA